VLVEVVWLKGFHQTEVVINDLLGGETSATVVQAQTTLAAEAGLSLPVLLARVVQKYGAVLLYLALAGLFVFLILNRLRQRESNYTSLFVAVQATIGVGLAMLLINFDLIERNPIRVSRYATVMAVVAVGLLLYQANANLERYRTAVTTGLIAVIVLAVVLGSFGGLTYEPNKQMTHAEHQGAEFTLENHDTEDPVRSSSLTIKTQLYLSGERRQAGQAPAFLAERTGHGLPPGIGYGENQTVSQTFESRTYIVTQDYDLRFDEASYFTPEQRRELGVYEERHLQRLGEDRTANKLYANGGFDLWKVADRNATAATE
jgi:hypothetical protein